LNRPFNQATMPKKAANTTAQKGKTGQKVANPLFEKRPRNWGIGNIQHPRDLTRFVQWPRYVKIQRQRRILMSRMKVPPAINQFTKTLDKASVTTLFKVLNKYRPESPEQKKQRLLQIAAAKAKGEQVQPAAKGTSIAFGLNKVTRLIEKKKAKLVILAHDVDPIELVVWIPALCRKLNVPFVIVKGKARLGALVHQKTASVVAITNVEKDDVKDLTNLSELALQSYNNNVELRRQWGGGQLGSKAVVALRKRERALAKEQAVKK